MQVNILEAKNRLSQLIKSAQAGEEVVIANRGTPMVRLVPAGYKPEPPATHILDWLATHPLPSHARRSGEQIDAALHDERAAWD